MRVEAKLEWNAEWFVGKNIEITISTDPFSFQIYPGLAQAHNPFRVTLISPQLHRRKMLEDLHQKGLALVQPQASDNGGRSNYLSLYELG